MQITNVDIRKSESASNVKAYATVTLDDCFVIHNVKVIERQDKPLLVVMPDSRNKNGFKRDVAHPINTETREMFTNAVLNKYYEVCGNDTTTTTTSTTSEL